MLENIRAVLERVGVSEYGVVDPRDVEFSEEVRGLCAQNLCHEYGQTWACPPAIGTVDECRDRAWSYGKMLVFSVRYDLQDNTDFEAMRVAMQEFRSMAHRLDEAVKPFLHDYLMLGNEGCGTCETCTYPDSPCRFPDQVHGSIEGYGIWVNKLAELAGISGYTERQKTVTYFGALLYNE
jgi:predicted metal-binding protein